MGRRRRSQPFLSLTRRRSRTSATSASSGWTPTRWGRRTSTRTSRRRWRRCATQSSRTSTAEQEVEHLVVECLVGCLVVCLVGCLEALELEDPLPLVVDLDQPLRKWTNLLIFLLVLVRVLENKKFLIGKKKKKKKKKK